MTSIRVISRPAASAGFALAGVATTEVTSAREAAAQIESLSLRPEIAVLLVEQELLDTLSEPERRELMRRPAPIIVPFPGPDWSERGAPAESYVLELLRRAIGYRVRLQ